jgi:hypothetical protein
MKINDLRGGPPCARCFLLFCTWFDRADRFGAKSTPDRSGRESVPSVKSVVNFQKRTTAGRDRPDREMPRTQPRMLSGLRPFPAHPCPVLSGSRGLPTFNQQASKRFIQFYNTIRWWERNNKNKLFCGRGGARPRPDAAARRPYPGSLYKTGQIGDSQALAPPELGSECWTNFFCRVRIFASR